MKKISSAIRLNVTQRRHLVLGCLLFGAVLLLGRAVQLQLIERDFLQGEGNRRHHRSVSLQAHRGMLLDRQNRPMAVSTAVDSLWVDPQFFTAATPQHPPLAHALGLSLEQLHNRLAQYEGKRFMYLARHLPPHQVDWIMENLGSTPGLYRAREFRRFYPDLEVAASVLGYTNIDDQGQEGLELAYDSLLKGNPGRRQVVRDRRNRQVDDLEVVESPQPGQNLTLSLDSRIQYFTHTALANAVQEHNALAGSAIVMDPHTGEILALANVPTINPNDRTQRQPGALRNRAVTDVFEPGSTMKPFMVAAALESGLFRPEAMLDLPASIQVGRHRVRDPRAYGRMSLTGIIAKSSNVGVAKLAQAVPAEQFWLLLTQSGFNQPTGLNFAGEQRGVLPPPQRWGLFDYATRTFGYGLSVNLVQLARAYSALAADGMSYPATLLKREAPPEGVRAMSIETAMATRRMLEASVSREGTARRAAVPGYRVGGKTGTAHKAIGGRYDRSRYLALFAGVAPISRPRIVMVIMLDEPKGKVYGGLVAAPIFSEVVGHTLRLLQVPLDAPIPVTTTARR